MLINVSENIVQVGSELGIHGGNPSFYFVHKVCSDLSVLVHDTTPEKSYSDTHAIRQMPSICVTKPSIPCGSILYPSRQRTLLYDTARSAWIPMERRQVLVIYLARLA